MKDAPHVLPYGSAPTTEPMTGEEQVAPESAVKSALDLLTAAALLVALAPILIVIAVLVKLESPGPVLHVDERVGRGGRRFRMYKFRSMTVGSAAMRESLLESNTRENHPFRITDDPHVTGLGRWLRRTSLDELPQLINVLRREMSLVGPRPLLVGDLEGAPEKYSEWKLQRRAIRPGMTGPWQVRSRTQPELGFDAMVRDDMDYLENRSLGKDMKILLATLPALFRGEGTY